MDGQYSGHLLWEYILITNTKETLLKNFYMKQIKSFLLLFILFVGGISCKKNFLDEKPIDFLSTTNAFQNAADFQASVNNLYRLVREEFYTLNDNTTFDYQYRTDIAIDVSAATPNLEAQINPN